MATVQKKRLGANLEFGQSSGGSGSPLTGGESSPNEQTFININGIQQHSSPAIDHGHHGLGYRDHGATANSNLMHDSGRNNDDDDNGSKDKTATQMLSTTIANVVFSLSLNVVSSVGVVFANKVLFQKYNFRFGTTLTISHFVFTFVCLWVCAKLNMFKVKKLTIAQVLPISLAFCGYVVFNNLSLVYNSVGFYQVMKILVTPCIMFIQRYYYKEQFDNLTKLSLIPTCLGIFITVATDVSVNFTGTIFAIAAVVSNALYTIWGKTKQKELEVDSMQILYYQSIVSAVILLFFVPIFDDYKKLVAYQYTTSQMALLLLTCILGYGVNFSFFLLVGKTSPLTVNVVGYFKTCLIFIGGFMFFDTVLDLKNLFGISMTLLGLLLYTYVKIK